MKKRIKYKYMRPDIDDKHGFLELQDKMLEIMVKINDFCQKNDIEYCLMGGSAQEPKGMEDLYHGMMIWISL